MKKWIRMLSILALVIVVTMAMTVPALAEDKVGTQTVPITVNVTGDTPETPEDFVIHVDALNGAPLVDGKTALDLLITKTGVVCEDFSLEYVDLGVYEYLVSMTPGEDPNYIYDDTKYIVTVYVLNYVDENDNIIDSEKFNVLVLIRIWDDQTQTAGEKVGKIQFDVDYSAPQDITVEKTWSNDNLKNRPTSVEVGLFVDEELYETATLNKENNWTYTWEGLSGRVEWTVKELEVPEGYTATYETVDGVTTITNTGKLIQTGQLNWPVLVLGLMGLGLVAFGAVVISRRKPQDV